MLVFILLAWEMQALQGRVVKCRSGTESLSLLKINWEMTMLVLSRKLGEKIVIGDNIVVTVVKIDRNQIRVGIEAPQDIPVYREEIAPERLPTAMRSDRVVLSR
jgi:carbon storage regulator